jgi:pantoate kinase
MKNQEIVRQLQRLRALMKNAMAQTTDISLQSAWARFFCVLAAGLLENAISEIYTEYVVRVASPEAANYAVSRLARIQNPNTEKFVETAHAFSHSWGLALEFFVDVNGRKEAIDSIMAIRHQIVHGKNAGISYVRVVEYLNKAEEVLEFIENQVRP